jgi:hypothetical protein
MVCDDIGVRDMGIIRFINVIETVLSTKCIEMGYNENNYDYSDYDCDCGYRDYDY